MTREEARADLMLAQADISYRPKDDSIDMAIDALKQEPCNDAISRQAVLKMAYDMSEIDGEHFTEPCIVVDVEDIQKLPPVTPQPKTGRWIGHREHCENLGVIPSGLGAYKWCSNCDCGIDVGEWHRNNYNFCPNCGEKMIGENNGKEKTMNNQEIGHCKDCDKWKKGKRKNNEDWYSDEGFCNNWRTMTGEDFYCGDFEVKENK